MVVRPASLHPMIATARGEPLTDTVVATAKSLIEKSTDSSGSAGSPKGLKDLGAFVSAVKSQSLPVGTATGAPTRVSNLATMALQEIARLSGDLPEMDYPGVFSPHSDNKALIQRTDKVGTWRNRVKLLGMADALHGPAWDSGDRALILETEGLRQDLETFSVAAQNAQKAGVSSSNSYGNFFHPDAKAQLDRRLETLKTLWTLKERGQLSTSALHSEQVERLAEGLVSLRPKMGNTEALHATAVQLWNNGPKAEGALRATDLLVLQDEATQAVLTARRWAAKRAEQLGQDAAVYGDGAVNDAIAELRVVLDATAHRADRVTAGIARVQETNDLATWGPGGKDDPIMLPNGYDRVEALMDKVRTTLKEATTRHEERMQSFEPVRAVVTKVLAWERVDPSGTRGAQTLADFVTASDAAESMRSVTSMRARQGYEGREKEYRRFRTHATFDPLAFSLTVAGKTTELESLALAASAGVDLARRIHDPAMEHAYTKIHAASENAFRGFTEAFESARQGTGVIRQADFSKHSPGARLLVTTVNENHSYWGPEVSTYTPETAVARYAVPLENALGELRALMATRHRLAPVAVSEDPLLADYRAKLAAIPGAEAQLKAIEEKAKEALPYVTDQDDSYRLSQVPKHAQQALEDFASAPPNSSHATDFLTRSLNSLDLIVDGIRSKADEAPSAPRVNTVFLEQLAAGYEPASANPLSLDFEMSSGVAAEESPRLGR